MPLCRNVMSPASEFLQTLYYWHLGPDFLYGGLACVVAASSAVTTKNVFRCYWMSQEQNPSSWEPVVVCVFMGMCTCHFIIRSDPPSFLPYSALIKWVQQKAPPIIYTLGDCPEGLQNVKKELCMTLIWYKNFKSVCSYFILFIIPDLFEYPLFPANCLFFTSAAHSLMYIRITLESH